MDADTIITLAGVAAACLAIMLGLAWRIGGLSERARHQRRMPNCAPATEARRGHVVIAPVVLVNRRNR